MSDQYTAWDGEQYPWPPPDGWYEASDSRWWAPGTGPNPPQASPAGGHGAQPPTVANPPVADHAPPTVANTPATGPTGHGQPPTVANPPATGPTGHGQPPTVANTPATGGSPAGGFDPNATAALPSDDASSPPTAIQPPIQSSPSDEQAAVRTTQLPPYAAQQGSGVTVTSKPPLHGPDGTMDEWQRDEIGPVPRGRSRIGRFLLVLAGAVAAVAVAGVAFLFLRDTGDDTAATGDEIEATDGASDDDTSDDGSADDDAAGTDGDPAADGENGEGESTDTAAPDETTDTTEGEAEEPDETTTSEDTTSTTLDPDAAVEQFREILSANGLQSDGLSDSDVQTVASQFCVLAEASEGMTEYRQFREDEVADANSELSDDELFLVIDAAIVSFCPEEAERLGVDLAGG